LYWDKFGRPDMPLKNGVNYMRWWFDEAKVVRLAYAMEGEDSSGENVDKPARPWWILIVVLLLAGWMLKRYFSRGRKLNKLGGGE
jgi:hypothetical protein